jgi:hypothetical protein
LYPTYRKTLQNPSAIGGGVVVSERKSPRETPQATNIAMDVSLQEAINVIKLSEKKRRDESIKRFEGGVLSQ